MRATLLHRSAAELKRGTHPGRSTQGGATLRERAGEALGPDRGGRPPHRRRPRGGCRLLLAALAVLATVAGLAGCATDATPSGSAPSVAPDGADPTTAGAGTVAPGAIEAAPPDPAAPGTPIAVEALDAPADRRAVRFSYHATGAAGRDVAITGVLVAPTAPPPPGGFPLIAWAHPTTGAADGCQPSSHGAASIPEVDELVARGWAVVATDYEGLGAEGPHPYLVGASEGHAVLDAALAASRIPDTGVDADSPVVVWGFSQGGHAGAFAAELAPTYAPELNLVGVALAAPVSDVAGFTRRAEQMDDQLGVVLTVVNGFAAAYPELDPSTVLTPAGVEAMGEVEHRCIGEINEYADRPVAEIIATPPTADPAFAARFDESRAGDRPIGVPLLVVQGDADDIVDPAATAALVERYCTLGVTTRYDVVAGVDHGVLTAEPFLSWISDRFAAKDAPSTC